MEFTPRIAQEWFCRATGPKAFYDSCEILFKPHCIDFTAGWTTLVKAGREVSKLLENNAFSRAYRNKQLPEQKVYVSAGENNSGGLSVQQVNLLFSAAKKTLIFLMPDLVRFRISHPGPGPVDITFILCWDGKFPCTLGVLKGRLSFLSLAQQFPAVIPRQGERESKKQALPGGCQDWARAERRFFGGSALSEVSRVHSTQSR